MGQAERGLMQPCTHLAAGQWFCLRVVSVPVGQDLNAHRILGCPASITTVVPWAREQTGVDSWAPIYRFFWRRQVVLEDDILGTL